MENLINWRSSKQLKDSSAEALREREREKALKKTTPKKKKKKKSDNGGS